MTERRVEIRVTSTGFDEAMRSFEKLSLMIDRINKKIDALSLKLDKLSRKRVTPDIDLKGLNRADASLDKLNAKLDKIGRKRVEAHVKVDVDKSGIGGGGFLSGLLKGGEGAAGSAGGGAAAGGGAGLGALGPIGIGTGVALLASLIPALLPELLGLGVGGLGAFGAYKLDKGAFKSVINQAKREYLGAIGNRQSGIFGQMPGFNPVTPLGPQGSFLGGIEGILSQIDRFIKSIGPGLRDMFMASLPIVRSFVFIMEQFAKAVMPAITQSLQQLKSTGALKILTQGFVILVKGIASFITALGPGMKDAAIIFKTTTVIIAAALRLAGNAVNWFAHLLVNTAEGAKIFAHDVAKVWDQFRHQTSALFDDIRHSVAHIWDSMFNDTLGTAIRNIDRIMQDLGSFDHHVGNVFDGIRHEISSIWDAIWQQTVGATERGISNVVGWFKRLPGMAGGALKSLGGELLSIGKTAISDMLRGMQSVAGGLLNWVKNFVSNIWNDVKKFFGFGSPSRLFYEAGKNIVLGMAHGIKDHAHKAVAAANRMAQSVGGRVSGTAAAAQAYGRRLASAYGWAGQWSDINAVAMRESGWNPRAVNPSSGAYGIAQFIQGPSEYYQYGGNPNTIAGQVTAFYNYIRQRYGNPAAAWSHEMSYGWYDRGGKLPPGLSLALNTTGRDEIHTAGPGGGGDTYNIFVLDEGYSDAQALRLIQKVRKYKLRHHNQNLGIA